MIENFNNHFQKICSNLNPQRKVFVLGLSGGLDSMALLYLLKNFLENNKKFEIQIFPVIIDHNLRQESSQEACKVKNIAKNLGFKTSIKRIDSKIPPGNIQNWARKKRRDILCETTYKLSANLLLAHHFDDQAETLFMRFGKKSGLQGLQGMRSISCWNGILIIRPLLGFKKKQLKSFVDNKKIIYFEDTSNSMLKFERVKTRNLIDNMSIKNWPNISNDLNKFSDINTNFIKKIRLICAFWVKQNILIDKTGAARVNYSNLKAIFEKSSLFTINIIGRIIQTVGGNDYPPKRKKTYNLICSIFLNSFNNKNLGNVNIFLNNGYLFFIREQRNLSFEMEIKKGNYYVFDGRFVITSNKTGCLISNRGDDFNRISYKNPFFEYREIINKTIPRLETLDGTSIKPHLLTINENSELRHKLNVKNFSLYLINRVSV